MNIDRLIRQTAIVVFALVLFGVANPALAQRSTPCSTATPNNALCVNWGAITTDTNGNAITGVTYRVERKVGSGAFTTAQASGSITQFYATSLAPGSYVFRVFANCSACTAESAASNEANGTATAIPVIPASPVIIIAATIRAGQPPTYRIVYTVRPRDGEIVFVAPESMRSVFAANR